MWASTSWEDGRVYNAAILDRNAIATKSSECAWWQWHCRTARTLTWSGIVKSLNTAGTHSRRNNSKNDMEWVDKRTMKTLDSSCFGCQGKLHSTLGHWM